MEHKYVYVEPSQGAIITGVCVCGDLLTGFGTTSLAIMLSEHIKKIHKQSLEKRIQRVRALQEYRKRRGYGQTKTRE